MPKKPTVKRKTAVKKPAVQHARSGARVLSAPRRQFLKPWTWFIRAIVPDRKPLPKAWTLLVRACQQLWQHKKVFITIAVVYGVLNLILVHGLSDNSDISTLKSDLDSTLSDKFTSGVVSFTYLLAQSGSGNTYQAILLVVCSLACIWALRQVMAGKAVRAKEAFYQGMYPLVPFVLLLLLGAVQLIPLAIGGGLYTLVVSNGIVVHWYEYALFLAIFALLAWWSLRMLTATIFALYMATLPGQTPLLAYRQARELVRSRRLLVWRKIILLPFVLLVATALVELPLIAWATPLAPWTLLVLGAATLPLVHAYLYNLYRSML